MFFLFKLYNPNWDKIESLKDAWEREGVEKGILDSLNGRKKIIWNICHFENMPLKNCLEKQHN